MLKSDIVKQFLTEYPDTPSKTLAIIIYRENPKLFKDVEDTRTMIRYYRGNHGSDNRGKVKDKSFFRDSKPSGNPFLELPEGIKSLNWNVYKIIGTNRILNLSDIHIPYHDKIAVELAVKRGLEFKPTIILLNGDILDFFCLSRWETNPKERDFPYEIEVAKLFFAYLRENFPKARIIWKLGNHEERLDSYMFVKSPELLGVKMFEIDNIYNLKKYRIEIVKDKRPIKINKLSVIHGHEYKFAISNPVNPARGLFLRAKANAMCFPADTIIICRDKLKYIKDIVVGDEVLTHTNQWKPVVNISKRLVNETVKLKGLGHPALVTTPEHPLLMKEANRASDETIKSFTKEKWVEAQNAIGLYWMSPTKFPQSGIPAILRQENSKEKSVEITEELMWVVGRWLGDGWIGKNRATICCGFHERDLLYSKIQEAGFTNSRPQKLRTTFNFDICRKSFAMWLKLYFGYTASEKTIPAWVLGLEDHYRYALFEGYISADGYKPTSLMSPEWECSSVSKKLAIGIKLLAQSLGYHTTLYYQQRSSKCTIEDREVNQKNRWCVKGIKNYRRWSKSFIVGDYLLGRVASIEVADKAEVFNMIVGEDSSYIADGIVVHNCGHFHQSSTHSARNIDDKIITTWSTGGLSELHPRYLPLNEWNHGFALIETEGNESFLVSNYKIIDNKTYTA